MENILELLEREDCIDLRDDLQNSLLHLALNQTDIQLDVIKQVLDRGLDVNCRNNFGYYPLHHAVRNPNCSLDVIKLLLDRGASIALTDRYGNCALHYILRESNCDLVKLLIDRGADVNVVNNDGDSPLSQVVHTPNCFHAPLVESNSKEIFKLKLNVLKHLLDCNPDANMKNNFGDSLLHHAVNNCDCKQDAVKLLLSRGADINLGNNCGDAPLHRAITSSEVNIEVIRILLDHGANVNAKNYFGNFPLYLAVKKSKNQPDVPKLLLDKGANVLACNKSGFTSLQLAIQHAERDDSALTRVKLLIKYTMVSSLGFDFERLIKNKKHYKLFSNFVTECMLEMLAMGAEKVGLMAYPEFASQRVVTLYELMRGYQEVPMFSSSPSDKDCSREKGAPKSVKSNINHIVRILYEKKFPQFNELIVSKVQRKDMIDKLRKLTMYTFRKIADPQSSQVVVLDFYSACDIADYLSNVDLLNWIMAYHRAHLPVPRVSEFPRQKLHSGKRSADEPIHELKRFKIQCENKKKVNVPSKLAKRICHKT